MKYGITNQNSSMITVEYWNRTLWTRNLLFVLFVMILSISLIGCEKKSTIPNDEIEYPLHLKKYLQLQSLYGYKKYYSERSELDEQRGRIF